MTDDAKQEDLKNRVRSEDWFLQSLVNVVNGGQLSFGVTLNVGGFLISGVLVSGKEYFDGLGGDVASGVDDSEAASLIQETFNKYGAIYDIDDVKGKEEGLPRPAYIHMRDARFFSTSGEPVPSNQGVWWRGRIGEVQGFVLGCLGEE